MKAFFNSWNTKKKTHLLLAAMMAAAAVLYFGALWAAGLKLRQLLRR